MAESASILPILDADAYEGEGEHDVICAKGEHDVICGKREHDVMRSKGEHDFICSKGEHDVIRSKGEHDGICGKDEHDVIHSKGEHGCICGKGEHDVIYSKVKPKRNRPKMAEVHDLPARPFRRAKSKGASRKNSFTQTGKIQVYIKIERTT